MVKVQAKVTNRLDNEESAYKGTVRVVLGEALSTSVMVMQGNNGPFISFPSYYSEKEQKYKEIINPVTKEAWEAITGTALKAFASETGMAEMEGDIGLSVTKAYATYLKNDNPENKKVGIGNIVVGDCLKISGINIYERQDQEGRKLADYFISLPSRKGEKDGKEKFYSHAYPLTTKLKSEIEVKMIDAVEKSQKLQETKEKNREEEPGLNEAEEKSMEQEKQKEEEKIQEGQEKEENQPMEEQQLNRGKSR